MATFTEENEHLLDKGFSAKTLLGNSITVKEFLAGGGQGEVYVVEYGDKLKALKWYKKEIFGVEPKVSYEKIKKNMDTFYENIKHNIMHGSPSLEFLWPLDVTEFVNGTFGYVMDLRPKGFYELTQYMLCDTRFMSYKTVVDAACNIVSAFRILHNAGYSYQDLNDGNFFINPRNGKVLICDNDNVAPDGTETGIKGKPRYMAPEIVLEKSKPNSLSDRFSMSLIMYILFCLDHPLEGKRYLVSPFPPELQDKLYGSEPLFIMDPNDTRNGPHPKIHKNSLSVWPYLPNYMQEIFLKAFSKEACSKPSARPKELDWLKVLTRFRSEIVACPCGNEVFTKQGDNCKCEKCGRKTKIAFKLDLGEYSIPVVKDTRIYRCQLGVCDETEALSPVAHVIEIEKKDAPNVLVIKNKSGERWNATTSNGTSRKVEADDIIPLKDGITFTVFDETITIRAN